MRRWLITMGVILATGFSATAQHTYLFTAYAYAETCGTYTATIQGKTWQFPVGERGSYLVITEMVTFSTPLATNVAVNYVFTGDDLCCQYYVCNAWQTMYLQQSGNCFTASGRVGVSFTKIQAPHIVKEECEYVEIAPTLAPCAEGSAYFYVSNNPNAAPTEWKFVGAGSAGAEYRVTVADVAATGFDPYGPLFIRLRYRGDDYRNIEGVYSDPSPNIPIKLYHSAPKLTTERTHQLCKSVSGVKLTNVTLALPKVRISVRQKIGVETWQNVMADTEYSSTAVEGLFFEFPPGEYELAVRNWGGSDPTDACPAIFPFTINGDYPAVDIQASVVDEHCFGPANTGSITLTPGGTNITPPYSYTWAHNKTLHDKDLTGLAGDVTYHVKVTDKNGCVGEKDITVGEPDPVVVTSAYVISDHNGAQISCPSNTVGIKNDGSIRIEAHGGTGQLQYHLVGGTYSAAYQTGTDFTGLNADTYTVYVKDSHNCEVQHAQVVPVVAPNDIRHSRMTVVPLRCNGLPEGSITIVNARGGTGALEYGLANAAYQASNEILNRSAATYTVSIRDRNGCRRDTAVVVGQPSAITFGTIDTSPQSCTAVVDGILTASSGGGTGALEYALADEDDAYQPAGTFSGLASGSYTVYARDANGCVVPSATQVLLIKAAIRATITVSDSISCHGAADGALRLNITGGGTAPYTILWGDQRTSTEITGLAAATYSVTVTDDKTCQQTWTFPLKEPDVLTAWAQVSEYEGFGVRCANGTDGTIDLQIAGGSKPFRYTWTDGPSTQDRAALSSGTYAVSIQDYHGCTTSATGIAITEPLPLTLRLAEQKDISCYEFTNGSITLEAAGGAGTYEYSRNNTTWQLDAAIVGLPAADYTLYVRDGNNCRSDAVTTTLTRPDALKLTLLNKEETKCGQANGRLEIELSGGVGNYVYAWFDETNSVVATTPAAQQLASGDYYFLGTDGNACVIEQLFSINDSDGPRVSQTLLQALTCHDSNDGAIGVNVSEGLTPYTITWDIAGEQGLSVANVTGGNHWIEVLDSRGCRNKTTFFVEYPDAISITPTLTLPLCYGGSDGSMEVSAAGGNTGGYTYTWATGESGPRREGLTAGSYILVVTDTKDCRLQQEIILGEPALYTVDAGGDRTICRGQQLPIQGPEDAVSYRWTSNAGYENTNRNVVLTEPAQYTLNVINANGCVAEDHFALLTSDDLLQADFLMAAEALAGDTIVLVDISWPIPDDIGWTFPAGARVVETDDAYAAIILAEPGTYTITLNTYLGECLDDLVKEITISGERTAENGRSNTATLKRFEVYPNPNEGAFSVQLEFADAAKGSISLLGLAGNQEFWHETLSGQASYEVHPVLHHLPAGIYLLVVENSGKRYYKRIAKK